MRRYLVAAAVLAVLVWSVVSSGGPRLAAGDGDLEPSFGFGAAVSSADETRNVFVTPLCLTGGRGATISDVRLVEPHGLVVRDFGLRVYPTAAPVTVDPGTGVLASAAFVRSPVTSACGGADPSMLAVTLQVMGAERGWSRGLVVAYVIDGRPESMVMPHVELAMCVQETAEATCQPPEQDDSDG
ncbi:hypothetical protein [Terrabacter sp. Root181]|uniref:hypothetical protein n=1 Tax=Terrabacter sp. Root181 TaxID=1736484 RepID=UPI0006FDC831|nr:hypothetical protein [Terrabacter sp. Root181]KRB46289.1 hypothetical protein ASD90_11355 [Terrabacter sp. Root181]